MTTGTGNGFWSGVGQVASSIGQGIGHVVNFTGSIVRNTMVAVSNVLPDGGFIGQVGDRLGNSIHIGGVGGTSGAPYSGGSSGGSFLTPFSSASGAQSFGSNLDFTSWYKPAAIASPDSVGGGSSSVAPKPATRLDQEIPSTQALLLSQRDSLGASLSLQQPAEARGSNSLIDPAAAPASASPQAPAAGLLPYTGDAPYSPAAAQYWVDQAGSVRARTIDRVRTSGAAGAASANEQFKTLSRQETKLRKLIQNGDNFSSPESQGLLNSFSDNLFLLDAVTRSSSPEAAAATANLMYAKDTQTKLKPFDGAIKTRAQYRNFNADVEEFNAAVTRVAEAADRGMTPELQAQINLLGDRAVALRSTQAELEGGSYTDWFTRYDARGVSMGVDAASIATWAQFITPFALAGIQYSWQSSIDKKNRKYTQQENERNRQFERELQESRLSAQLEMAGMHEAARAPAAVGRAAPVSIRGGTQSA